MTPIRLLLLVIFDGAAESFTAVPCCQLNTGLGQDVPRGKYIAPEQRTKSSL